MHRLLYIAGALVLIGHVFCEIDHQIDVNNITNQLQENIPGLENFNASKLPSEEDVERMLKEKCEKNGGGEEAFQALKNQQQELRTCLEAQMNATQIQLEVEEAKKTGSMDEIFGKYCRKYPEIYQCVEVVIGKVKPCLDEKEKDTMNQTLKILDELKEFVCFKDGDRIAMFVAEGGVECLESRKDELQQCANQTLGSRIPTDMSATSLPVFLFTDRECNDFDKIRACFNDELEKCKDSTPANIVDAFFKFLKKHMPCNGVAGAKEAPSAVKESGGNSAGGLVVSTLIVGVSVLISKFL
ncbi:27 kDa hemolymph protein [Tribolium castaneum]|uniref:27 kDa hemolymph protein-like Protein n=1 Tax=Tribolium castaneum TaxID=7070 RepID=D6WZA1_TRICA|nr:PREDICTED: 27 kDa hemolymph protein [Tribolium castaneum]EFA09742.1 27 kDa hemolymph protein-like Protein [Tribolium castaneum]|eukprot:XP_975034.1 PREDICTED: 27 kDa hemolymph protein [Tribolium castaneum]